MEFPDVGVLFQTFSFDGVMQASLLRLRLRLRLEPGSAMQLIDNLV